MTKGERDELAKILKARARLAKNVTDQRAAALLADVEERLAAEYKAREPQWADLTAEAKATVGRLDAQLAERCRALGIPEEFRPSITLGWFGRGQNGDKERRAELRKVAQTRIVALAAAGRVEIETKALDGLTMLAQDGLASDEARAFLSTMPTAEALMPVLDVSALGPMRALGR